MKNSTILHNEVRGREIWERKYEGVLGQTEKEYQAALRALVSLSISWKEFSDSQFGVSDVSPADYRKVLELSLRQTAMEFASTLYSAINSPLATLSPVNRKEMLFSLREVMGEIGKPGICPTDPSEKEVMIACLMMLGENLKGRDANKDFYFALAEKLVYEILADKNTSLATRMLTLARASLLEVISEGKRDMHKAAVVNHLEEIKNDPSKIVRLGQGWKTYVWLARMVFAWRHMYYGLKHDTSKDLRVESYLIHARYFYK